MYPDPNRFTDMERANEAWVSLRNDEMARHLSLHFHDQFKPQRTDAQPSRAVSPNPATIQHGGTAAKGI